MLAIEPQLNKIIRNTASFFHNYQITPVNIVFFTTILSLIYGFFPHLFGYNSIYWLLLPFLSFLRIFSYSIIQSLERGFGHHTNFGDITKELGGIISDGSIIIGLLAFSPETATLLIVLLVCSILTQVSGLISKAITGRRELSGPMGDTERSLAIAALGIFMSVNLVNVQGFSIAISAITILCVITIWIRVTKTLEMCES